MVATRSERWESLEDDMYKNNRSEIKLVLVIIKWILKREQARE